MMPALEFKRAFFNSDFVKKNLTEENRAKLARMGAYGAKVTSRIPRRRKGPSKPGQPPSVHAPSGQFASLRTVWFAWDGYLSVVFGPVGLGRGSPTVPNMLEFGANVSGRRNPRRKIRKLGDGGEIRIGGRVGPTTKPNRDFRGRVQSITYAKLRTPGQVSEANRLNEQLYGPEVFNYSLAARPFVKPGFDKTVDRFAAIFGSTVSGGLNQ